MLSVELSAEDAERETAPYSGAVSVAVSNSRTSTVLSGSPSALEEIRSALDERGVFCRPIKVDVASHSPQVEPLGEPLPEALDGLAPRDGEVPVFSTVRAGPVAGRSLDAAYWLDNLRQPVRLAAVTQSLLDRGPTVFVEISPHPILLAAISESLSDPRAGAVMASLHRDEPERAAMLDGLGALYRSGAGVDFRQRYASRCWDVSLPRYPWQRSRYWPTADELAVAPAGPRSLAGPPHALLGRAEPAGGGGLAWTARLDLDAEAYLTDHQVQRTIVFPGMGYIERLIMAARLATGDPAPELTGLTFQRALFLGTGDPPELRVTLRPGADEAGRDGWAAEVASRCSGEDGWITHVTGRVRAAGALGAGPAADPDAVRARCPEHGSGAEFYRRLAALGNDWRPTFQGMTEVWRGDGEALARVQAPATLDLTMARAFHPAVLDSCAQALAVTVDGLAGDERDAFLLGSVDAVRLYGAPAGPKFSHARRTSIARTDSFAGDITVTDAVTGALLAEIRGMRLQYLEVPESATGETAQPGSPGIADWCHELIWRPVSATGPASQAGGYAAVLADGAGVGELMAGLVRQSGRRCVLIRPGASHQQPGPDEYRAPLSPEGLRRVLDDADTPDGRCAAVLDLRALDAVLLPSAGPGELDRIQREIGGGALAVLTACAARPAPPRARVDGE